ncbi:OmpA family protein [Akkermansiaceae bacterium]|nr:OmpA family protein [Akkermansiaceae bacterium]
MAEEYSWEQGSSYLPPQREGFGWPILIAVVIALVVHLALLIYLGGRMIKFPTSEPHEWVSRPVSLSEIQTEVDEEAEEPAEEIFEKPEIDGELVDSVEDAIADLKDAEIDFNTEIEDPLLPEVKIEQPALIGDEEGTLPEPVVGNDTDPVIPEAGRIENLFPEAANGQIVIDDGSPLADVIDPDAVISELGKKQGAGGQSDIGVIKGYTGLDEYAKMSPGDLQENKASIGSDLLFAYNESTLRDDARLTLMKVAMLIDRNPTMYCWVEGHTDTYGRDEFNEALSEKRAQAVKDWLVKSLQLDPRMIVIRPFGKTAPIVLSGTKEEQAPNRRVDIKMRQDPPGPIERPVKMLVKPGKAEVVSEEVPIPKAQIVPEEDPIPKAEIIPEDIPEALPVNE